MVRGTTLTGISRYQVVSRVLSLRPHHLRILIHQQVSDPKYLSFVSSSSQRLDSPSEAYYGPRVVRSAVHSAVHFAVRSASNFAAFPLNYAHHGPGHCLLGPHHHDYGHDDLFDYCLDISVGVEEAVEHCRGIAVLRNLTEGHGDTVAHTQHSWEVEVAHAHIYRALLLRSSGHPGHCDPHEAARYHCRMLVLAETLDYSTGVGEAELDMAERMSVGDRMLAVEGTAVVDMAGARNLGGNSKRIWVREHETAVAALDHAPDAIGVGDAHRQREVAERPRMLEKEDDVQDTAAQYIRMEQDVHGHTLDAHVGGR